MAAESRFLYMDKNSDDCRIWSLENYSAVDVEGAEKYPDMESWFTAMHRNVAKTSDGKGQVVDIVTETGRKLLKTVYITSPYLSSHHMIVIGTSLFLFAMNGAFLHYKLNHS